MKTKRFSIIAILIIVAVLATACAGETAAPAATPGGTAATTTATAKPSVTAQPAAKIYKWTIQGGQDVPGGLFFKVMEGSFANIVEELSGGRLIFNMHGPGELVPYADMTASVQQGTLDATVNAGYYDIGRDTKAALVSIIPFGLTSSEYPLWYKFYGGEQAWKDVYNPWNIEPYYIGCGGAQILGQTRDKYNSMQEWKDKGLVVRSSGLQAYVYQEAGFETVFVSGGELFTAMERGVIDIVEYAGAFWNYTMGYHEIAPWIYGPGWHENATGICLFANKDKVAELPEDLKIILKWAAEAEASVMGPGLMELEIASMEKLDEYLTTSGKGGWIRIPDSDMAMMYDARDRMAAKQAEKDPEFGRVFQTILDCKEDYAAIDQRIGDLSFER